MGIPFMQFYPGDYLRDTMHFNAEEHGTYLLLLMAMWTSADGTLPNDDKVLARLARTTARRWAIVKPAVFELLLVDDDRVSQKRLLVEREKTTAKSESRSRAGKIGAAAKALKNQKQDEANAERLLEHSSEPNIRTKKKEESAAARLDVFSLPDFIPKASWDRFEDSRKKMRKPMTPGARDLMVKRLRDLHAKGHDVGALLDEATLSGWLKVYPPDKPQAAAIAPASREEWITALGIFFNGGRCDDGYGGARSIPPGTWATKLGPAPGKLGCRAPADLIARFKP